MKDGLHFAMYTLLMLIMFIAGSMMKESKITKTCDKLNSFYSESKVYECKLK